MADELNGKKIAFLVANSGAEQVELTTPWDAVKQAGGSPVLIAPKKDTVQAFNKAAGKPIAAICHAPWTLIEADLVRGKTLTSFPSLQTDVRNAGGTWRDVEVFTCPEQGFPLVTSRNPDDLEAFSAAAIDAFAIR